jgi:hypothetical protein
MPSLSEILVLTLSIVSEGYGSKTIVLPVSVFTNICIASASSGASNKTLSVRLALRVDMRLMGLTSLQQHSGWGWIYRHSLDSMSLLQRGIGGVTHLFANCEENRC